MSRDAILVGLAALLVPLCASARPLRPRFEPDDLELQQPGTVEVDLQAGFIQSRGPYRLVVPDVEIDIGVLDNLEIDLDWTYAIEQPFDHSVQDNVWLAAKVGLLDLHNRLRGSSWALGVELGPRLGAAPGASGAGFEALALVAHERRRVHLVLNAGGVVEPMLRDAHYRPLALEVGVDFALDLDERGRLDLIASAAAVHFVSVDPDQAVITAGIAWSPRDWMTVSLTGLVGFLDGGDRIGLLVGYSQRLTLAVARRGR